MSAAMEPIDVAWAALVEAGRRDLALEITGWEDEGGFYLEADRTILSAADWKLIDRAEDIARQSIGLGPYERSVS
jgi:hypothetical protein